MVDPQQPDRAAGAIDEVITEDRNRQSVLRRTTRRAAGQEDDDRKRDPREPRRDPAQLSASYSCQMRSLHRLAILRRVPSAVHLSLDTRFGPTAFEHVRH